LPLTRAEEIALLLEVNTRIAAGDDPSRILPRIIEAAQYLTAAEAVVVRLVENDRLVIRACSAQAASLGLVAELPLDRGLSGHVARHGQPLMSNDLDEDDRVLSPSRMVFVQAGFHSCIVVPLRAGQRVIGTMSTWARRRDAFGQRQVDVLLAFGDQVAIALDRARILEQTRHQAQRLLALHRITSSILGQEDEGATLRQIVSEARALLQSPGVALFMWSDEVGSLRQAAVTDEESTVPEGARSVIERSFASQRALVETANDRDHALSAIAAPLVVAGHAMGVLAIWSTADAPRLDGPARDVAALFGEQAALAVLNARLRQAARAEADAAAARLVAEALVESAEAMARGSTNSDVAHAVARVVPTLLHPDVAVVRLRRDDGAFAAVQIVGDATLEERERIMQRDGRTLPSYAALIANPVVMELEADLTDAADWPVSFRSQLIVPLVARGDLLGFLVLIYRNEQRVFSPRERALAEGIARQASMALDNIRLRRRDWEAARLDGAVQAARAATDALREPVSLIEHAASSLDDSDEHAARIANLARELQRRLDTLHESLPL
jgi:GAF domain-containing protein